MKPSLNNCLKTKIVCAGHNWQAVRGIALAFICSFLIMCLIFPGLFVRHEYSFIRYCDGEFPYLAVFSMLTNLFHGGVQLWNRFDQMPLSFAHLTSGVYAYNQVITGICYFFFSRFFPSSAVALDVLFSTVLFAGAMFVRTAGTYLLARHFTRNRGVIFLSCLLANTVLVYHFYIAPGFDPIACLLPLAMHFILRFFERPRLKDFLLSAVVLALAVSTKPLFFGSYFYQALHFFILSCFVWFIAVKVLKRLRRRESPGAAGLASPEDQPTPAAWKVWAGTLFAVILVIIIVSPSVYMAKANYWDYDFSHENSRFHNVMSVREYFKRPIYYSPKSEILPNMINYADNKWTSSWLFLGYLTPLLVILAMALYRDGRKYIFLATAMLLWLINGPRMTHSFLDVAHWINALTNPLKFMTRTMHAPGAFLMPYVFSPLMIMGLDALIRLAGREQFRQKKMRIAGAGMLLLLFLAFVYGKIPAGARVYMICGTLSGFILIAVVGIKKIPAKVARGVVVVVFLLLFVVDCFAVSRYYDRSFVRMKKIQHQIPELVEQPIDLDYRNPEILPFRFSYRLLPIGDIKPFYGASSVGMSGVYFQFTYLGKFLEPADYNTPRHKAYRDWAGKRDSKIFYREWAGDQEMLKYLCVDQRMFYLARLAVEAKKGMMSKILKRGWSRNVIMVDGALPEEGNVAVALPDSLEPAVSPQIQFRTFQTTLGEGRKIDQDGRDLFVFQLPEDFPDYLSSTVFTNDQYLLRVVLGREEKIELAVAQGKLIVPLTFDVQNISRREFSLLLDKDTFNRDTPVVLFYPHNLDGISRIWKNQPDNLGFDYTAAHDGWLVLHYPYDEKWQVTVDDRQVKFYRVNKSFIGFPIAQGNHRVLFEYWPNTPLRGMIGFSVLAGLLTLAGVLWIGINQYPVIGEKRA